MRDGSAFAARGGPGAGFDILWVHSCIVEHPSVQQAELANRLAVGIPEHNALSQSLEHRDLLSFKFENVTRPVGRQEARVTA